MAGFKLASVEWETDLRELEIDGSFTGLVKHEKAPDSAVVSLQILETDGVGTTHGSIRQSSRSHLTPSMESLPGTPLQLITEYDEDDDCSYSPLPSGNEDRPHTPDSQRAPTPPRTFVQGVTWGCDVIRAVDADDPRALMDALTRKGGNPNAQVDKDGFGGYRWSAWCHRMSGDTVLHLCLRWKKTKALGGLYPLALSKAAQAIEFKDDDSSVLPLDPTDPDGLGIPLSGVFDLSVLDAQGFSATALCASRLPQGVSVSLGVSLPRLWLDTQRADRLQAKEALEAARSAFEASKRKGFKLLNSAHGRAREEYRLAVRSIGTTLEGDALLGHRRVLAAPPCLSSTAKPCPQQNYQARVEARHNMFRAAGGQDQAHNGAADDLSAMPGRPGGKEDAFPVDLSEVRHSALRDVLLRVRDGGRHQVQTIRAAIEFRYGGCLGSEGGVDLGLCLPACLHLTALSLPNQRVGAAGGVALAEGLAAAAPCLTYVDLRSNALKTAGALPFAHALKRRPTLRTLCLDANRIDGPTVPMAFTAALEEMREAACQEEGGAGDGAEEEKDGRRGASDLVRLSLTCNPLDQEALAGLQKESRRWLWDAAEWPRKKKLALCVFPAEL
mmetsp:Transcript_48745/g.98074  ORF Transcript_48745/g.98074 Transcript_48745/m.98074 type:complete len:613 (+) Transcript_48745:125-1963(+)